MSNKIYYNVVSTIFLIVAIAHFLRILNGWDAMIGEIVIPMWVSWVAMMILVYLVVRGLTYKK